MVCLGNICRSPMAEGVLRHLAAERGLAIITDSAGTGDYHVGEPPDRRAQAAMRRRGLDISDLRARQFVAEDFERFDLLLVMDSENLRNMLRLAPTPAHARKAQLIMDQAHPALKCPETCIVRRQLAVLAATVLLGAAPVSANPGEVNRALPTAQKVGEASYSVLSVRLFNAELYADGGAFSWERPFALTLTYYRSARASTLINRSVREMSSRGAGNAQALAPLRAQLERCFTNVASGDRITGVSTAGDSAVFYHNGARRCDITWPNFRRHFFGIWLAGHDGAAAHLSAQLRGRER